MTRYLLLPVLMCLVLMTSSLWRGRMTGLVTAASTYTSRTLYCSEVLRQTRAQEIGCNDAPRYYSGSSSTITAVIPLLCCLGVFDQYPVTYKYKDHLDLSFITYIYGNVDSFEKEEIAAIYVAQCYLKVKANTPPLLKDSDYLCWVKSGRTRCQC